MKSIEKSVHVNLKAGIAMGFIAAFVVMIWSVFWKALTTWVLWSWFAVPLLGLPALSMMAVYGLVLVATSFRGPSQVKKHYESDDALYMAGLLPMWSALLIGLGWIIKLFI